MISKTKLFHTFRFLVTFPSEKPKIILMEFNGDSPRSDWVELAKTLLECGYKVYKIGDHRGPDVDFQSASENPDTIIDEIKSKPFSSHGNVNVWFKVRS